MQPPTLYQPNYDGGRPVTVIEISIGGRLLIHTTEGNIILLQILMPFYYWVGRQAENSVAVDCGTTVARCNSQLGEDLL